MILTALNRRLLTLFISAALLLAAVFTQIPQNAAEFRFELPGQNDYSDMLNAAVTIKTQKAADSIEGGTRGIDVSKYQGTINWSKVASDNVEFAFIRASCGVILSGKYQLNEDPMFEYNATQAHKNGIKVGAYHYAILTSESRVKSEAQMFLSQLRKVNITYPVVVDAESNPGKLSRSQYTRLVKYFADLISSQGYTVMVYSYQNFIRDNIDVNALGNYKLWVANYTETPKYIPHSMWQHTSVGRVSGISGNVDINIAYPNFAPKQWKTTSVNKTISNKIKDSLNQKYGMRLSASGTNGVHEAVITALQIELNKQLGANVAVNGVMDRECLEQLDSISFGSGTKGNITALLQARLFYMGYYKSEPSGVFDGKTNEALRNFQYANGLSVTGTMNSDTVYMLFG